MGVCVFEIGSVGLSHSQMKLPVTFGVSPVQSLLPITSSVTNSTTIFQTSDQGRGSEICG